MSGGAAVVRWRQRMKEKLVVAFGGRCGICGYAKSMRALTFHHVEPAQKKFSMASNGVPRSWKRVADEARKCVMLCHNCHDEVHEGSTRIPDNIRRFDEATIPLSMRNGRVTRRNIATLPRDDGAACEKCGAPLRAGLKFCSNRCRSQAKAKVPDRPEGKRLREMVVRASRVKVAARYGVSEAAVRKWLRTDSRNGVY
jgi:hypothetical protein